jgi:hypothetical protein
MRVPLRSANSRVPHEQGALAMGRLGMSGLLVGVFAIVAEKTGVADSPERLVVL